MTRADSFAVQSGGETAPPKGMSPVPLEIRVAGDAGPPIYSVVLEESPDVRRGAQPALPFSADGTLALARNEMDPDSALSAFFFLLKVR